MEIGTVKADKKLKIYTIKGKRVDREDFQLGAHVGEAVPIEASSENIKKAVDKALAFIRRKNWSEYMCLRGLRIIL